MLGKSSEGSLDDEREGVSWFNAPLRGERVSTSCVSCGTNACEYP